MSTTTSRSDRSNVMWAISAGWLAVKAAIVWFGLFLILGVGVEVGLVKGFTVLFGLLVVNILTIWYLIRQSPKLARLYHSVR